MNALALFVLLPISVVLLIVAIKINLDIWRPR